jgi:hypothetical protein
MTALEILKKQLTTVLNLSCRTISPQEISDISHCVDAIGVRGPMLQFPLPIPDWDIPQAQTAARVLTARAWEGEGSIFFLVDIPADAPEDEDTHSLLSILNAMPEMKGRYFINGGLYYNYCQAIFCNASPSEKPVHLNKVMALREAAAQTITYALTFAVQDISRFYSIYDSAWRHPETPKIESIDGEDIIEEIANIIHQATAANEAVVTSLAEFKNDGLADDIMAQAAWVAERAKEEIYGLRQKKIAVDYLD